MKHAEDVHSSDSNMSAFRLILLYQVVLRPMCIVYLVSAGVYFLKSKWWIGAFLMLIVFFVWFLWKWVQWTIVTGAYVGPPAETENEAEDEPEEEIPESHYPMSYEEADIISTTMTAIGYTLGLTAIALSIHYGMRVYLAIPLGLLTAWLGAYVVGKGFVAYSVWIEIEMMDSDEGGC